MNYYEFSKFQPISKQTGPNGTIHMSLRFTEKPLTNLEFEDEVPGRDFQNRGRRRDAISGRLMLVGGNWRGDRATGWRGELEDDRNMARGGLWPAGRASRRDDGGCSGGDGDTTAVVTGKWAREGRREALDT